MIGERAILAVVLSLFGAGIAAPAQAQQPPPRQGFWLRIGLGYGTANWSCDGCGGGPREGGVTGSFEMGGTLNPYLRLGGFGEGWTHETGGGSETMSTVGAALYYYPVRTSGLFFKGGLGFSSYDDTRFPPISGTGWGLIVGTGYEVPVGRTVSLVPFVDYVYGGVGDINYDDGTGYATGWNQNFFSFGLSVAFSPGSHRRRRRFGDDVTPSIPQPS